MTLEEFWELLDDYRCAILNGRGPSWRQHSVEQQALAEGAVVDAYNASLERIAELEAELYTKKELYSAISYGVNEARVSRARIAELEAELAHAIEYAAPRPFHIVLGVNDE